MTNKMNRVSHAHLSISDWEQIILEWEKSGKSQQIYCQEKKITIGSFGYWRTKLKNPKQKEFSTAKTQPSFSAVKIIPTIKKSLAPPNVHNKHAIEFQCSGGNIIKISNNIDNELLKLILDMVGR